MIVSKCFKCGGERVLLSRSIDKPDYASHTEDECITHLNARITAIEASCTDAHGRLGVAVFECGE